MKKLLFGLITLAAIMLTSCDHKETKHIRKNANSIEAKKDIEALNKAMAIMRAKDCSDPLSWYYQGAIHWIPDTIKDNKLCESYHNVSDIKDAWDNCTHTPSGKEKMHFLIWHRLYIYHFEKIVRKLSGYDDFALPYWGYTNNNDTDKVMPKAFRDKNSALYEACRFQDINNGKPISGEILRALDLTKLNKYTSYRMYCQNINNAPHGAMHDYIGAGNDTAGLLVFNNPITGTITNTGLMGWVPTAGFDPIFWMHHSNIDRIWQQWTNSDNGVMPTMDDLKDSDWKYVFYDENGKRVEYTVQQALDICFKLDYDYDDTKVQPKESNHLVKLETPKVIGSIEPGSNIKLKINRVGTIKGSLMNGNNNKNVILEVTVSFTKTPKGVYEVYVNNQNGFDGSSDNEFAGFMTFFGSDHKMPGNSCKNGCCRPLTEAGRPTYTFEYEVPSNDSYDVSIYKHNGVQSGDLMIENITIKTN